MVLMEVLACRDISNTGSTMDIREIVEYTPFRCRVLFYANPEIGLIRIEYDGHSEDEIKECDLKLTAKIITYYEAKGSRNAVFFPLEFGPRWFLGLTDKFA